MKLLIPLNNLNSLDVGNNLTKMKYKLFYIILIIKVIIFQIIISFSLNENECEALKIELSPQLSIGVISDNLGKVTLFEVNAGGIIR